MYIPAWLICTGIFFFLWILNAAILTVEQSISSNRPSPVPPHYLEDLLSQRGHGPVD